MSEEKKPTSVKSLKQAYQKLVQEEQKQLAAYAVNLPRRSMKLALAIHYPENTNQEQLQELITTIPEFFATMHHAMSLRKLYSREAFFSKLISDGYESFTVQREIFRSIVNHPSIR